MKQRINPTLIIKKAPHRPNYPGKFERLDTYITGLPVDTIIQSSDLKKTFDMASGNTIGGLLRQRDDLINMKKGRWKKV